ncbi:MAG: hypothetical protein EBR86_04810 [Planctomycetia bacterium]|nr:hypothetical protein [Planctomycetia bacterium]
MAAEGAMRLGLKRQHVLLVGLVLFLAGVQFRLVESFTLSEKSTRFIVTQLGDPQAAAGANLWQATPVRKVVSPPRWLGLALMSVGSVLTLRSLSMKGTG